MLSVENLSKSYPTAGGKLWVFRNLSFQIPRGEFFCIVGPSGCGKTTLLNILSGLDQSYIGTVSANGTPITGASPQRIVIFQELGLFPWLDVQRNVEFGLKMKDIGRKEREAISKEYLAMVNLYKFRHASLHELSGGMKQRVALARALAMDPEILLMDEPFASLDAQTRDLLHAELQKIWMRTKKTVVFVTHNVREAVCLGDRVAVLSTSPATIKTTFTVDFPRTRHIEDPGLIDKARMVLDELRFEIDRYFKRELNG